MLADINGNLADLRSEAMASQRFCLRWNNHQSNLLSVFDQLLHDEAFVDVTLAVEGQLLRAHKMVLSACSPYFQALFTNHPDKHPIVILKDVPYVDMRSLLDFMYRGEVSVDQDRLPAFLRVAESLRIKGLTEVNEEKCDLPSITSSLLGNQNILSQHQQQQQQHQQQQQQQPPPNLHRINQIGSSHHHHGGGGGGGGGGQKRYHHMSSHPLLGSALTAPKRKRGRPRKLSGSSDTGGGDGPQDLQTSDLVQGSPEMMEMKMGIDFQSETSTGNGNANNSGSNRSANSTPGPITGRKDDSMENGERDTPEPVTPKIKKELEPTPSTSAQESGSGSPAKSETSEKNKGRDSSVSRTSSPLTPSQTETAASRLTPTTTTTTTPSSTTTTTTTNSTTVPSSSTATTTTTTNNSSTTTATATTTTSSTTTTTTTASSNNKSASPAASGRGGNQVQQQTPTGEGAMSAPTGRQVPKRRMRRRATSQSQDPAEQLTEMSVRGLNLFRYASISEGVYQCTECAKLDIQKTFKNKYSFQRHAFLYHEGHQRKVFPCPVCAKEFSRPDKMKNHMKTVHDCFMPKDCVVPFGFYNL